MSVTQAKNIAAGSAAEAAKLARAASRKMAVLSEGVRNAALEAAAARLEENAARILAARGMCCKPSWPRIRNRGQLL